MKTKIGLNSISLMNSEESNFNNNIATVIDLRRSKFHEKNVLLERALNFDQ